MSVYSGRAGACCCGCAGKHYYASATRVQASHDRGYGVDDDEVNDKQVVRVLNIIKKNASALEVGRNNISVVVGKRLYVAYPLHWRPRR